jgi:hypothetical protein
MKTPKMITRLALIGGVIILLLSAAAPQAGANHLKEEPGGTALNALPGEKPPPPTGIEEGFATSTQSTIASADRKMNPVNTILSWFGIITADTNSQPYTAPVSRSQGQ